MNPQFQNPNPNSQIPQIPPIPQTNPNLLSWVPLFSPQQQNPLPNLPLSLSSLHSLTSFTDSIFTLFTSNYPSITTTTNPTPSLLQCPHNPHHWVPHHGLFVHFLNCPSPIEVDYSTLQYPLTVKNDGCLSEFFQVVDDPSVDLCFCLDDFVGFESSFFYKDCPGVVVGSSLDGDGSHNRMFSLPGWLALECANFVCGSGSGSGGGGGGTHNGTYGGGGSDGGAHNMGGVGGECGVRVLPSEIWVVRCEVECWNDCPNSYSFSVVRAILCLEYVNVCELEQWVVGNSLRYGVVIDVPMSKHMVVLFSLCLNPIVKEAAKSYRSWHDDNNHSHFDPKSLSFECPVLVGALKWLISQLSILYGEMNAKLFVLSILKHWLPKAASKASLFPISKGTNQLLAIDETSSKSKDEKLTENEGDGLLRKSIYVYQIAVAIAALHERSLLEERIKALRNPLPLTAFQRNAEHAYFSKKADEERSRRPDYRPLMEHDSLPSQRQHNQDTGENKTVEELLAEERDYKRRRMSYRGKKSNRTPKEVMRDIIEDYTEAIKQAGGIGCLVKEDLGSFSAHNTSAHDSRNFKSNQCDQHDDYRKRSYNDYNHKDSKYNDHSSRRYDHHKKTELKDEKTGYKDRHDRGRSPSRDKRHDHSREDRYSSRSSSVNKDSHSKGYHTSDRYKHYDHKPHHSVNEDKRKKLEHRQRGDKRSESSRRIEANDRYDPYKDEFDDSRYMRPES